MNKSTAKGVVSAGSRSTAEAGISILQSGGNAVDAAIAAAFAVAAGEPTVTSLGGAGMMMLYHRQSDSLTTCDFFANAPTMKPQDQPNLDFFGIDLDYGPTQQTFFVGRGSAAVPGVIPGLGTVHDKYGVLPFETLLEPAISQLEHGVELGPRQRDMGAFLEPILTREAIPKSWFSKDGKFLSEQTHFALPQLARTLRDMQSQGWQKFYSKFLVPEMLAAFGPTQGGLLTPQDFEQYEPIFRVPTATRFFDHRVFTVPSPAAGGPMIALMLRILAHHGVRNQSPEELMRCFCAVLETADAARMRRVDGLEALPFETEVEHFQARCKQLQSPGLVDGGPPSTTHISVIDGAGNAVAVTLSHGESNAYNIGNSGIMMNNFLGESDLLPQGFGTAPPGLRLATMMSPTIGLTQQGGVLALGTGGANRIRSAIMQSLWHLIAAQISPDLAITAPRMHYEGGELNLETFDRSLDMDHLRASIPNGVNEFHEPNLYFGGVNCAVSQPGGTFDGAGDPRRGGVCLFA
jgi:gamma-glutamyltranspeptidase / glutathione hydrolase